MKTSERSKLGRNSRKKGKAFEILVRHHLEMNGWLVFRNSNSVEKIDTPNGQTIQFKQAKNKFNPFTNRIMTIQSGFPDFLIIKKNSTLENGLFQVQLVECKIGKYLDKEEKSKCDWIIKNLHIPILIASKKDKEIVYKEYETSE